MVRVLPSIAFSVCVSGTENKRWLALAKLHQFPTQYKPMKSTA